MYRFYLIFIFTLSLSFSKAWGQYPMAKTKHKTHGHNRHIKGRIIVAATGKPITGLTVAIYRVAETKTDSNGNFNLKIPDRLHSSILYINAYGKYSHGEKQDSIQINQEIYSDEKREIMMYWMPVDSRKEHINVSAYKIPGIDTANVIITIIVN